MKPLLHRAAACALLLAALVGLARCRSSGSPSSPQSIFLVAVNNESFRILLRDSQRIAQARGLIGTPKIVAGTVVKGNGGFNAPWNWHLDPDSVRFADAAVEVCDGLPSYVEAHLGTWAGANYCPWGARIVAEQK